VFSGHNLFSCLEMTKNQLLSLYWESFRFEARERLGLTQVAVYPNMTEEGRKSLIEALEMQAYPVDPEADGDMDREDIENLKSVVSKMFGG
jgi:hypothetical protein